MSSIEATVGFYLTDGETQNAHNKKRSAVADTPFDIDGQYYAPKHSWMAGKQSLTVPSAPPHSWNAPISSPQLS